MLHRFDVFSVIKIEHQHVLNPLPHKNDKYLAGKNHIMSLIMTHSVCTPGSIVFCELCIMFHTQIRLVFFSVI